MSTLLTSAWMCQYLHQLTQNSGLMDYSTTAQDLYQTFRELVYDRRGYLHFEEVARNSCEDSSTYTLHISHLRQAALQLLDLGGKLAALDASAAAVTQSLSTSTPLPTADVLDAIQTSQNIETARWHLHDQIRRTFDTARWWLHDLGAVITDELEDEKVPLPLWQQIADKRFHAEEYRGFAAQLEAWFAARQRQQQQGNPNSPHSLYSPRGEFKPALTPLHHRLIRLNIKRRHYILALQQQSSDVYTVAQLHAFQERGVNFPAPPHADAVIHGHWTEPPPSTTITTTTSPQGPATITSQCPYCLTPVPTSLLEDKSSWRSHLTSDLRHLTCLTAACGTQETEGFVTVQGWVEHLATGRNIGEEYDSFFDAASTTKIAAGAGAGAGAAAHSPTTDRVPHTSVPDTCPICLWRFEGESDGEGAMLVHLELELRFFALLAVPWAAEKPYELFVDGAWEEWVEGQVVLKEEVNEWVGLGLLEDREDGQVEGEALGRLLERAAMGVD
ncbi:hypothetical protein ASPACDRAFT_38243 [Aspergillus aculeatus ATCC 16872]|uniref:Uncharacterized protein n=1 Tax=Aspergillus aculeatus (strain ATCC 16872 / CBS 172.66 / WB 5094) TaxID=690307 RepID=A0A1L9X8L3_ASPA1|nr:uncharacterized protein ASPACDRAFT_38243 [Aspergillus aculeatus ATCC 16872]OJK04684.1 hypothetical protein ASPACDRAFT_38243 [Aspergillus aculeatus ATCC 16872]